MYDLTMREEVFTLYFKLQLSILDIFILSIFNYHLDLYMEMLTKTLASVPRALFKRYLLKNKKAGVYILTKSFFFPNQVKLKNDFLPPFF